MSKLLKFKMGLNPLEAATLLGSLINETVEEKDIEHLYESGWLTMFYFTDAKLYALTPIDLESRVFRVDGDKGVGHVSTIYLPCETVDIVATDGAYSIVDSNGNFYIARDNQDFEIHGLNSTYNPEFKDLLVEPKEVYRVAAICNSEEFPAHQQQQPTENNYASFKDIEKFYNFISSESRLATSKSNTVTESEPKTSQLLALASILDIALEKSDKRFTQSSLIDEVMDRADGRRGLSQSGLTKLFASARKAAEDWKQQ